MKPKSRQENVVEQAAGSETLIYDLTANKVYLLNETSAFIWRQCDGTKDVREIAQKLAKKNRQPVNEDIVWLAIENLEKDNLLTGSVREASPLSGMNRREVIKKVGLATMIALPVVSAIIAPQAISAASGTQQANNTVCTANSQCASGRCTTSSSPSGRRLCCAATTSSVGNPGEPNYNFGNTSDAICTGTIGPQYCCSGSARNVPGTGCLCN